MVHIYLLSFDWSQLLQPQWYVEYGGLWLLLFVVFAETGLFVGFFLPGDSLLFIAGIYVHEIKLKGETLPGLSQQFFDAIGMNSSQNVFIELIVLIGLISIAGITGNLVGYWTGRRFGPAMYSWKDRWLFKKRYLLQAHEFYEKHGVMAIVVARFIPFIRTFAPIIAGIVAMDRKKFHFFNIVGCIAWVSTMVLAGYFLQRLIWRQFHFDLKDHLEIIVLGIVLVTTAPVLLKLVASRKKNEQPPNL